MRLTYWYCRHKTDSNAYSIRAKTKRDAETQRNEAGAEFYEKARRVTVEYRDGFDLMMQCSDESRNWWEWVE